MQPINLYWFFIAV